MKSSGYFASEPEPVAPAPYPSGTPGDWRMFLVGVLLIGLFLGAWALSPIGVDLVPGELAIQELATRPAVPTEALALQERYTPTMSGEGVYPEIQRAEDL